MNKKITLDELKHEASIIYHRRLIYVMLLLLFVILGGMEFYHRIEGWRYLDSLYFVSYTLTTVGFGDFTPKTDIGKTFTIIYLFTGVGVTLYGVSLIATHFIEERENIFMERMMKGQKFIFKNGNDKWKYLFYISIVVIMLILMYIGNKRFKYF